jgi:K+ transporter
VLSFCVPLHAFGFQVAFTAVVFPCLLIAYMGQAAFLMKNPLVVERIFYDSVPGKVYLLARILNVFLYSIFKSKFWYAMQGFYFGQYL